MKYIKKYEDLGIFSKNLVFDYLIKTFKKTIRTYDFFVAWDKILDNVSKIEISLNILNSLIGKQDIEIKFKQLIKSYPQILPIIPILVAIRQNTIKVLDDKIVKELDFSVKNNYSDSEINEAIIFADKCGLLNLFKNEHIKNLVDYVTGIEVGLDTNARKNRSGTYMEMLVEFHIKNICEKHSFEYIKQASTNMIETKFNKTVNKDKNNRKFDFVINAGIKLFVIEVNYFESNGSKLKSVAGEFVKLHKTIDDNNIEFIWITDGEGWLDSKNSLLESFNVIDYIININMIEQGLLEAIVSDDN